MNENGNLSFQLRGSTKKALIECGSACSVRDCIGFTMNMERSQCNLLLDVGCGTFVAHAGINYHEKQ